MWIERLDIDGFGRLAGRFVFSPGLTLVTGPNEAGKTTLQEALVRTMFGFTSKERRRYAQRSGVKDQLEPWVHPRFGLVALLHDVGGRSLRVEWDFDAHCVTLRDADTGDDLSQQVRGARGDVELGPFLLGLQYNDYCQVCRLDQTTLKAVERSDSLVNALQEAVESIGSDVRVAEADSRLSAFLSTEIGVHSGHYNSLPGKVLARTAAERIRLIDELEVCERARDEIAELTRSTSVSQRQVEILEDQLEQARQQLLRTRALDAARTLDRARQLAEACADETTERATLPEAHLDQVKLALDHWAAATTNLAAARKHADTAEPRLAALRDEERELQQRADGLSPYQGLDTTADAQIRTLHGRLRGAEDEAVPHVPPPPDRDPALARYRERRGELLTKASASSTGFRRDILATAAIVAVISVVGGIAFHPAFFLGALAAAALVVIAGRGAGPSLEIANEFGASSLEELERKVLAEDAAVAAANAAAEQAQKRSEERARSIADVRQKLAACLQAVGVRATDDVDAAVTAYLVGCERAAELREVDADLARCRAALVTEGEALRDLQKRTTELDEAERGLREALRVCGVDEDDLVTAQAAFETALRASTAAAERAAAASRTRAALDELLDGRSIQQLQDESEAAEQRLREHVAAYGEVPPTNSDAGEIESAIRDLSDRLRDAREELTDHQARIEERQRDLPEPSELKVGLVGCEQRLEQLELARDAVRLARVILAEAALDAHRAFAPYLNQALARNLPRITGDRYREVVVSDELTLTLVAPETGRQVRAESLSRGTQDQIFLVQRLELARMLDPTKGAAPLLLDDPFARCDPDRVRFALEVLGELATGRQIIVFSEDPQLADVAAAVCDSCHVIELAAPTERAPHREAV